jgi:PHS family inorganic phosphate transporter-like MFS transporter
MRADEAQRQRLYGVELFIVIFSTIGLAQCSRGILHTNPDGTTETSMSIQSWLMAWRFCMGVGIGIAHL